MIIESRDKHVLGSVSAAKDGETTVLESSGIVIPSYLRI